MPSRSGWWIVLAAAGAVAYVYRDELREALQGKRSAVGWYVKLYNYPRGHGDRRLKAVEGPFETKSEADDVAEEERDVWYPQVVHSAVNPLERE